MATVAVYPTSPVSASSFCAITVDAADQNDDSNYDNETYPASPAFVYYLTFEKSSVEFGRSYTFSVDEDGGHVFPNYLFPEAGTWVVHLRDASDDSSVADSGNVTVS